MANLVKQFQKVALDSLKILDNQYVLTAVRVFLILYAGLVAPRLPSNLSNLFDNSLFKAFILFLIAYVGVKNPTIALLVAVGFTVSMVTLRKAEATDSLAGLLDSVIDGPQEVAGDLVDDAQDLVQKGVDSVQDVIPGFGEDSVIGEVVDNVQSGANALVDAGQDVVNSVIDAGQNLVGGVVGTLAGSGDVQGFSGNLTGASL